MISNDTLRIADELASIATDNNVTLTPRGETPLQELYRSCVAAENTLLKDSEAVTGALDDPVDFVGNMSRSKNVMGVSDHDVNLEEIVSISATAVATVLSIARNQVNPLIRSVTEEVKTRLEDEINNISNPISIEMENGTPLWTSPTVNALVEKYKGVSLVNGYSTLVEKVEPIDFVNSVKTGIVDFDNLVERINRNGSPARGVFNSIYHVDKNYSSELVKVIRYFSDDELILLFLMAVNMETNTPTTKGMGLEDFTQYNMAVKVNAAVEINNRIEVINRRISTKRLITSYPAHEFGESTESVIRVNGNVYKKWLTEGGSPEVLFGALLSDRNTNYQDLLTNKDKYLAVWGRKERLLMIKRTNQSFVIMQRLLTQALTKEINTCDSEEQYCVVKGTLHERLKEHVGHMCADDINDLYLTVRHLVCNVFFPHTDVKRILSEMDVILRAGEVEDPKEAALYVAVNYVSDWVADQITTV